MMPNVGGATHAGTAGVILDFSEAPGVFPSWLSFLSRFFSSDTIRLEVIVEGVQQLILPLSHKRDSPSA